MAVEALKCKECSTEYPLEALLRLRQVLRPAGGRIRLLRARRGRDQAEDPGRPALDLALRRLPAVRAAPAHGA